MEVIEGKNRLQDQSTTGLYFEPSCVLKESVKEYVRVRERERKCVCV